MITTDTGAKTIEGSDNWREIFDAHNDSVAAHDEAIANLQDGLAIVADGNTHAAIASGQFVYVKNHSSLADGLYTATAAIATNATLSTSNLTADASGGLNTLNSKFSTGYWYPHIYDYDTKLWEIGPNYYFKIGDLYFVYLNARLSASYTFGTMLQIRNLPCQNIMGGNIYCNGVTESFGDRTIQSSGIGVYVRPNFTGTLPSNSLMSGLFIGY